MTIIILVAIMVMMVITMARNIIATSTKNVPWWKNELFNEKAQPLPDKNSYMPFIDSIV